MKDHRSSPLRGFEFIEFESPVDVREVDARINLHQGDAPDGVTEGGVRAYKIQENQNRTAGNNDVNLVREFERQPGPVQALAYSPDGTLLAAGSVGGEVRVYRTDDGKRAATCKGHDGAVFALAFAPDGKRLVTAGFDGLVRVFNPADGKVVAVLNPVPPEAMRKPLATAK